MSPGHQLQESLVLQPLLASCLTIIGKSAHEGDGVPVAEEVARVQVHEADNVLDGDVAPLAQIQVPHIEVLPLQVLDGHALFYGLLPVFAGLSIGVEQGV